MAINQGGPARSLSFTKVGAGPVGPVTTIKNHAAKLGAKELVEFKSGNASVTTRYAGTKTASIMIETEELAKGLLFEEGQKYTNVLITLEAASDAADTPVGGDIVGMMSHAVVTEVSELSRDNSDKSPVSVSITFTLDRHVGLTADPTSGWSAG